MKTTEDFNSSSLFTLELQCFKVTISLIILLETAINNFAQVVYRRKDLKPSDAAYDDNDEDEEYKENED